MAPRRERRRADEPPRRHRRFAAARACCFANSRYIYVCLALAAVFISIYVPMKMDKFPDIRSLRPGIVVDTDGSLSGEGKDLAVPRSSWPVLRFVPRNWVFKEPGDLDERRREDHPRLRPPRLALVADCLAKDSKSLMILTLVKSLEDLGYSLEVFTIENREKDRSLWERVGCKISAWEPQDSHAVVWSNYVGVILISLEGKRVISRLMVEPFISVPLIWIIQEDSLANRLVVYEDLGWQDLISEWRTAFSRADVIVFPDFTLPILHSSLDTGNFIIIPEYPVNNWAKESFMQFHSPNMLRKAYGFTEDELIILVLGSYFHYNELPSDYATAIHALIPFFTKAENAPDLSRIPKFILLFGESTDDYSDAIQTLASDAGLPDGSLLHFGLDHDVKKLLLMADIALYGSFEEEQGFPPLLLQAMSFEIPIVAPDLHIITQYVLSGKHCYTFEPNDPESLRQVFSILIVDNRPSLMAKYIAYMGRLQSTHMLAKACITSYANILEKILEFPSDVNLPEPISHIQQTTWLRDLFDKETEVMFSSKISEGPSFNKHSEECLSIVYLMEEQFKQNLIKRYSAIQNDSLPDDYPTQADIDEIKEMEDYEELVRSEKTELDERMDRTSGSWEKIRRNIRRAESLVNETKERDDRELEMTGNLLCIYEIYSGEGALPYLHQGSIYRGIDLLGKASRTEDINAVDRLPLLNNTYYRDILCELGAMFSIAYRIDSIHKFPWIGFQSWRAAGEKVSLSAHAVKVLEDTIEGGNPGDVIYFWAAMKIENYANFGRYDDFWFMCDAFNAAQCSSVYQDAFRHMHGIPTSIKALPPMRSDLDKWSTLHSWVMPTHSFQEFVMFSRMFVDSLDHLSRDRNNTASCVLGSSMLEKRHCYCRLLEMLVNVWAYHSGKKMVYIDPVTGELAEQHPPEHREMWIKYFNFNLLKKMDEDLAEKADDQMNPIGGWLWPFTGEVHWKGISDRERVERHRIKMDRKRRARERLIERHTRGYKQRPLADDKEL